MNMCRQIILHGWQKILHTRLRMNRIFVLMIFGGVAACCHGQNTPPVSPAADTVIATVLDKKITTKEATRLNGIIFGTLLEKYAAENKIAPSQSELDTFDAASDESEKRHLADLEARKASLAQDLQSSALTEQQRKTKESSLETIETSLKGLKPFMEQEAKQKEQMRPMKLEVAKQVITKWKVNKAVYDQYGGRVIFQQAGDEPMDAYRAFLKDEQAKGNFKILDAKYETSFWEHFDISTTGVYSKEEADKVMNTPWWMKTNPTSH